MNLKKLRILKGLTQSDVAQLMDVDITTVVRWEKNPDGMKVGDYKKLLKILQGDK